MYFLESETLLLFFFLPISRKGFPNIFSIEWLNENESEIWTTKHSTRILQFNNKDEHKERG